MLLNTIEHRKRGFPFQMCPIGSYYRHDSHALARRSNSHHGNSLIVLTLQLQSSQSGSYGLTARQHDDVDRHLPDLDPPIAAARYARLLHMYGYGLCRLGPSHVTLRGIRYAFMSRDLQEAEKHCKLPAMQTQSYWAVLHRTLNKQRTTRIPRGAPQPRVAFSWMHTRMVVRSKGPSIGVCGVEAVHEATARLTASAAAARRFISFSSAAMSFGSTGSLLAPGAATAASCPSCASCRIK